MEWQCPACYEFISSVGDDGLAWNIRKHIHEHERRAGMDAVEQARSQCTRTYCGIGTPTPGEEITEYDRDFLKDNKVRWQKRK